METWTEHINIAYIETQYSNIDSKTALCKLLANTFGKYVAACILLHVSSLVHKHQPFVILLVSLRNILRNNSVVGTRLLPSLLPRFETGK